MFGVAGCCSAYCGFSSLEQKIAQLVRIGRVSSLTLRRSAKLPPSFTYMWSAFVCSRAAVNCFDSASSLRASRLVASSATRGWNNNDLCTGLFIDESDIGKALSTTKKQSTRNSFPISCAFIGECGGGGRDRMQYDGCLQSDILARPASVVTGTLGISRSFMIDY